MILLAIFIIFLFSIGTMILFNSNDARTIGSSTHNVWGRFSLFGISFATVDVLGTIILAIIISLFTQSNVFIVLTLIFIASIIVHLLTGVNTPLINEII